MMAQDFLKAVSIAYTLKMAGLQTLSWGAWRKSAGVGKVVDAHGSAGDALLAATSPACPFSD
jgi:hypothetical protein